MKLDALHSCVATVAACTFIVCASPTHADAIDGTWCSPAGEQVTINGEDVTTPGGNQVKGQYTRHSMAFQIPPGEAGAGKKLYMEQLHEGAVKVTTIAEVQVEPGPHEDWTRCKAAVS